MGSRIKSIPDSESNKLCFWTAELSDRASEELISERGNRRIDNDRISQILGLYCAHGVHM